MKRSLSVIGVIILLLVLLLGSLGVWAYFRFLYVEPLNPDELARVSIDWDAVTGGNWSPWYDPGDGTDPKWNPAASFNAWLARVPEEDKAWPILVEAYYAHRAFLDEHAVEEYSGSLPSDPLRWERLAPRLATPQANELLASLLEAYNKPVLGAGWSDGLDPVEHAAMRRLRETEPEAEDPGPLVFDPLANSSMLDTKLTWLGRQRRFATFACSMAAHQLQQGRTDRFVRTMESLLRSSDQSREIPVIISGLVEATIEQAALRTIDWAISTHPDRFDEASLARLDAALAHHANADMLLQGEAMMFEDTIRCMCDDRGRLVQSMVTPLQNGQYSLGEPVSLPITDLGASAQRVIFIHRMVLGAADAQARIPWDTDAVGTEEQDRAQRERVGLIGRVVLDVMLPALDSAAARFRQYRQEVIGVRVGIAAHRHALRHGAFPDAIASIEPDLMGFEPIDAFTGQTLGYALTDSGPLVYSFGPDRVDNDGAQGWDERESGEGGVRRMKKRIAWITPQHASATMSQADAQWDWVLFPMPPDDPQPLPEEPEEAP